jgi:hypothetical protein
MKNLAALVLAVLCAGCVAPNPPPSGNLGSGPSAKFTAGSVPQQANPLPFRCTTITPPAPPCTEVPIVAVPVAIIRQGPGAGPPPSPPRQATNSVPEPAKPAAPPEAKPVAMASHKAEPPAGAKKQTTDEAAAASPASADEKAAASPTEKGGNSVAWVADDSLKVGLAVDGSTDAFRKQLRAAIEHWQEATSASASGSLPSGAAAADQSGNQINDQGKPAGGEHREGDDKVGNTAERKALGGIGAEKEK